MTDNEYLMKVHDEILEIMDVVHAICIKHNLKYYLTGGSLLGAVRHKGFIPWDDDLDIAMPRNDYSRFLELCKIELPKNFYLKSISNDIDYRLRFSKVCKQGTLFLENANKLYSCTRGIFVDIFPLDETRGVTNGVSLRKKIIVWVSCMIAEKTHPGFIPGIKKYLAHLFTRGLLLKILNYLMCMTNGHGNLYYTNFASQYPVERKTQLKTVYGNGIPLQFENRMYMAPDDYKTDLLSNFGPKYMELPPVEKRRIHYPVKVVFSDGSIYEPTTIIDNIVSVEESINW